MHFLISNGFEGNLYLLNSLYDEITGIFINAENQFFKRVNYKNLLFVPGFILLLFVFLCQDAYSQSRPLSYFLKQAYQNDPQIAASRRNVKIAGINKEINLATFRKPLISGDAFALWAPGTTTWGFDKAITNGGEYDALLNVAYPLLQKSNLKAYNQVSLSQSKQASYNVRFREHSLKRQVTRAYISLYGDQQQINYLNNLDNLLQQQLQQLSHLVSGGLLKATDMQQIRLEDEQIRIQFKQAQNKYMQDQSAINQLCGIGDTTSFTVRNPGLLPPEVSGKINDIKQSMFLQSFGIDSLVYQAQQKVQDATYMPQLNAVVNGGLSSSNLRDSYHHLGFTVGLQLNWKLWDGGQKSLEHQRTKLNLDNVRDQRKFEIMRLMQQRNSLKRSLQDISSQITEQEKQVHNYKQLLDVYRIEIGKGIRSVTDYITVFRQYLSARDTLNSLNVQKLQTINKMNYWNW